MEKHFTVKVNDTKKEIVDVINKANLPALVLKIILKDIYEEIESVEQKEIQEYYDKIDEQKDATIEKEGDK